ncbi:MAG: hypothetical protein JWM85_100, partial [Acidimicrobiaceae bacterium]|nr:hypothetical protein [Acidimicrobiaceae bacterium]
MLQGPSPDVGLSLGEAAPCVEPVGGLSTRAGGEIERLCSRFRGGRRGGLDEGGADTAA